MDAACVFFNNTCMDDFENPDKSFFVIPVERIAELKVLANKLVEGEEEEDEESDGDIREDFCREHQLSGVHNIVKVIMVGVYFGSYVSGDWEETDLVTGEKISDSWHSDSE